MMFNKSLPLVLFFNSDFNITIILDALAIFSLCPHYITARFRWFALSIALFLISFLIKSTHKKISLPKESRLFFAISIASLTVTGYAKNNFFPLLLLIHSTLAYLCLKESPSWNPKAKLSLILSLCPLLVYILLHYFINSDPDYIFISASRNAVSIVIFFTFLFFSFLYGKSLSFPISAHLVAAILILPLNVWAAGRMGILCNLILIAMYLMAFLLSRRERSSKKRVMAVLGAIVFSLAMLEGKLISSGNLKYVSHRFREESLVEGHRAKIIREAFEQFNIKNLLLGTIECKNCEYSSLNNNFHNSYLKILSNFGIIFFIYLIGLISIVLTLNSTDLCLKVILLTLVIRALSDEMLLLYPFDVFFILSLLKSLSAPKVFNRDLLPSTRDAERILCDTI